jgi:hypothetical protein
MSPSSPPLRRRIRRSPSRLGGRNRPPKRSRTPAIRLALLATAVACGSIATGAYFAFRDDVFAGLVGRQTETQISYEDQIADLRAQIDRVSRLDQERVEQLDRVSRLDQERVEQQIKPLLQRQATLEQVTSGLAKELSIQARNSLPASGAIGTAPLLSPIETPLAPIVATPNTESAKQADQAIIRDKKPRRPHRKYVRVKRKRMQEASTVAGGRVERPRELRTRDNIPAI